MSEVRKIQDMQKSFINLSLEGKVLLDEVDDFIDAWHKNPGDQPLHQFLGMSHAEYSLWLLDPDTMPIIIKARHEQLPLTAVVHDYYRTLRSAGRPEDSLKVRRLGQWLEQNAELGDGK
jgi:hypothetical protein